LLDSRRGPRGVNPRLLPADLDGGEADPLTELLEHEAQQMLQAALARLPTTYRAAYLLWTHEDMPYHNIAQVLGISEETARWRVCKARQMLAKQLRSYLNDPKR
jgi:RNA polymerase sigma-70 factor (ECF subfamily)